MIGYLLLIHCAYSSYEYNKLGISYTSDLILELVVSLVLIFLQATNSIKNKGSLNLDNSLIKFDNYLKKIKINESLKEFNSLGFNNYNFAYRKEYIDIVKMRKEYNEFMKE